ncbi:MAG: hypothetical protein D6694_04415 [Gammaproteobacteria bacterium]|nr:MAG: hypothetical protein D6694_04415 [Gammaproteobacteria bacterium]
MNEVDIYSKGEVARYLTCLADQGQVQPCKKLIVKHGHAEAYYPECIEKLASRLPANNVATDPTAYAGPGSYDWPKCPSDCPRFEQVDDLFQSVIREIRIPKPKLKNPPNSKELSPPEKVTLAWLWKHVPARFWASAIGILFAAFMLGIQASRLSLIKEMFGLGS